MARARHWLASEPVQTVKDHQLSSAEVAEGAHNLMLKLTDPNALKDGFGNCRNAHGAVAPHHARRTPAQS